MRNAFWLVLIAGALAAIVGGYVQGVMSAKPPPVATLRASAHEAKNLPPVQRAIARNLSGGAVDDLFTQDDVVVERVRPAANNWHNEQLSIVVGLCGESIAAQSGFLRLGDPMAFIVDPHASQAAAFAKLVRDANQTLLVQVSAPPSAVTLASLHRNLGAFDGIAARNARGMAWVLRTSGLIFFDERGDSADSSEFATAGVTLFRRDVTADDRSAAGYVSFMLSRAAGLSRRVGTVVVLVRPLPSSLEALRTFDASRSVTLVALR
ncbi:MAG TPA: divergent polysaccharide deacetylase family protein [Candidatus Acidoferrales bacterium]|nr:divergent polysaccharide deacetylase family protein [Candidatus Acidoferrales bacterium]